MNKNSDLLKNSYHEFY